MNVIQLARPVQPLRIGSVCEISQVGKFAQSAPVRINPVLSDLQKRLEVMNGVIRQLRAMGYRIVGEKVGTGHQRPAIEIGKLSAVQKAPLLGRTKGFTLRVSKEGVRYGYAVLDGVTVLWEEI